MRLDIKQSQPQKTKGYRYELSTGMGTFYTNVLATRIGTDLGCGNDPFNYGKRRMQDTPMTQLVKDRTHQKDALRVLNCDRQQPSDQPPKVGLCERRQPKFRN